MEFFFLWSLVQYMHVRTYIYFWAAKKRESIPMLNKGGSKTNAPPPSLPPRVETFWGFLYFDCVSRIYFNTSRQTMFTICILFPIFTFKNRRVCVKGHQNKPQTLKFCFPRFEIPGSATAEYYNTCTCTNDTIYLPKWLSQLV